MVLDEIMDGEEGREEERRGEERRGEERRGEERRGWHAAIRKISRLSFTLTCHLRYRLSGRR
jgi:hypothetical protein